MLKIAKTNHKKFHCKSSFPIKTRWNSTQFLELPSNVHLKQCAPKRSSIIDPNFPPAFPLHMAEDLNSRFSGFHFGFSLSIHFHFLLFGFALICQQFSHRFFSTLFQRENQLKCFSMEEASERLKKSILVAQNISSERTRTKFKSIEKMFETMEISKPHHARKPVKDKNQPQHSTVMTSPATSLLSIFAHVRLSFHSKNSFLWVYRN